MAERKQNNKKKRFNGNSDEEFNPKFRKMRKKVCTMCANKDLVLDYKNYDQMKKFVNEKDLIIKILNRYLETYDANDEKQVWFDKIKTLAGEFGFATDMKLYKENPDNFKGSYGDVASLIRIVLTTQKNTPDLYDICKLLGKETMLERVNIFANK